MSLYLFIFISLLWGIYRYIFKFPEWIDEVIFKPLLMLLPVILVVKILEKKRLSSLGLVKKNFVRNCLIGILAGIFISLEAVLAYRFKSGLDIFTFPNISLSFILVNALVSIATGLVEEIIFRGYFLNRFWNSYKSEFVANLLSTFLFVIVHIPRLILIPEVSYYSFDFYISLIQLFALGALNGIIFARTKTVVAPTASHAIWNFSSVVFK